jgi:hemerythrin-like domain-containing protein
MRAQYDVVRGQPEPTQQPQWANLAVAFRSRGLNSIYLQARNIKPSDEKAFCNYILTWHNLLHVHHTGEETDFFPEIEELVGEKGIMDANVEQHHAFHDGLENFAEYIKACRDGSDKYDGNRVIKHIDSFGTALIQHLADEIPTIEGLRKYGDKLQHLPQMMQAEAEKNMVRRGFPLPCFRLYPCLWPSLTRLTESNRPGPRHALGLFPLGRHLRGWPLERLPSCAVDHQVHCPEHRLVGACGLVEVLFQRSLRQLEASVRCLGRFLSRYMTYEKYVYIVCVCSYRVFGSGARRRMC